MYNMLCDRGRSGAVVAVRGAESTLKGLFTLMLIQTCKILFIFGTQIKIFLKE